MHRHVTQDPAEGDKFLAEGTKSRFGLFVSGFYDSFHSIDVAEKPGWFGSAARGQGGSVERSEKWAFSMKSDHSPTEGAI